MSFANILGTYYQFLISYFYTNQECYLFEMERRGYLTSGEFVPEVALEHPEVLENLHKEFQHEGSNIVQAFTYNGHREKMKVIGKEELIEPLNRQALKS